MAESDLDLTTVNCTIQDEVSLECSGAEEWTTYFNRVPPVVKLASL